MKWTSAKDKLPEDGEDLLLRFRGIIYLARFNKPKRIFQLKDGTELPCSEGILWGGLVPMTA